MARLEVPPTKGELMRLRQHHRFLQEGHDLLERKRELLTRLVEEQLKEYLDMRNRVRGMLAEAYRWLAISDLRMGRGILTRAGHGISPAVSVRILPRSSLGVQYASVKAQRLDLQPVSLMWTEASFDESRRRLADLAVDLARLGEAEMALHRLLEEHRKTQKRVNALKHHIIPQYRETIRYVAGALEEEERDALYQMKLLSERQ